MVPWIIHNRSGSAVRPLTCCSVTPEHNQTYSVSRMLQMIFGNHWQPIMFRFPTFSIGACYNLEVVQLCFLPDGVSGGSLTIPISLIPIINWILTGIIPPMFTIAIAFENSNTSHSFSSSEKFTGFVAELHSHLRTWPRRRHRKMEQTTFRRALFRTALRNTPRFDSVGLWSLGKLHGPREGHGGHGHGWVRCHDANMMRI